MNDDTLLAAWRRHLFVPLTLASLVFLVAWALPVLVVDLDARWQRICWWATWLTWALFAVDYLTQLLLSPDRKAFVRGHLFDLAVIALPVLRPLQLLRVVMVLYRLNHSAASALRGNIAVYGSAVLALVLLCASLVVLRAESRHPDANLLTFGDALWWSVTTVSTVGYGDFYPVTLTGRLVAATLFLVGWP